MAALRQTGLGPGLGLDCRPAGTSAGVAPGAPYLGGPRSRRPLLSSLSVREEGEGDLRGHPGRFSLARARDASQRVVTLRPDSAPFPPACQPDSATNSISRVTTS